MTRPTYATARTASVTATLAAFRTRFGVDPVAVIVNVGAVEQVEAALGSTLPVLANGGCLLGEVWLVRPALDVQAAAQSLRVSPVQVAEARQLGLALEV